MSAFGCVGMLMVLGFVGCSEESPPQAPPAPIVHSIQASPMPEITAGVRPTVIRNAKLFRVHQFVSASDNDDLQVGDMVCIEGVVDHDGERMGAKYCTLSESSGPPYVSCEGDGLRQYQILHGRIIIVHGRIAGKHLLADASLVTQQEIDEANSVENE